MNRLALLFASCALVLSCQSMSLPSDSELRREQMTNEVEGHRLRYYLLAPPDDLAPDNGWPLLLFLHGAGERGDDLDAVKRHGPLRVVDEIEELSRCVLVVPQCPADSWWRPRALEALVDEVTQHHRTDPNRLYVTGLSMGGYGTWSLLAHAPSRFAAAVPICGGGDPRRLWPAFPADGFSLERLLDARHVPLRIYHGDADRVIPVEESRFLVDALHEAGATDVQLTVYENVGHDSWTQTYRDPELYRWLFAQELER